MTKDARKRLEELACGTPAVLSGQRIWTDEFNGDGIIVFSGSYLYETDQSRNDVRSVREILSLYEQATPSFDIALLETSSYGVDEAGAFFSFGDTVLRSDEGHHPKWAIIRSHDWRAIYHLEQMGIPCFPSSHTTRITADKGLTLSLAAKTGVRIPKTFVTVPRSSWLPEIEYPAILKSADGNKGDEVFRVLDASGLASATRQLGKEPLYQESMPTGNDLRVYCVCGEIVKAMYRRQGAGDFRANKKYSPEITAVEPSTAEVEAVRKLLDALGDGAKTGFICCDFLFDAKGQPVLCEMNATPGINILEGYEGNFFSDYLDAVVSSLS